MHPNFKCLAIGVPVEGLLKAIERKPELWKQITARQTTPGSPHTDTESIFLRWCKMDSLMSVFTEIPAFDWSAYDELPEAREIVDRVLREVGAKELGRVLIAKLEPNGFITPHADEGDYADHYERFHVVLKSAKGNEFFSETDAHNWHSEEMLTGELWWFNHKDRHCVHNGSSEPRIHLIVDAVAPEYRRQRRA